MSRYEQRWAWEALFTRLRNMRPTPDKNSYVHLKGIWLRALEEIHVTFDKA